MSNMSKTFVKLLPEHAGKIGIFVYEYVIFLFIQIEKKMGPVFNHELRFIRDRVKAHSVQ